VLGPADPVRRRMAPDSLRCRDVSRAVRKFRQIPAGEQSERFPEVGAWGCFSTSRSGSWPLASSSDCPPSCGAPLASCFGSVSSLGSTERFGQRGGRPRGRNFSADIAIAAHSPSPAILRASARAFPGGLKGGRSHPLVSLFVATKSRLA